MNIFFALIFLILTVGSLNAQNSKNFSFEKTAEINLSQLEISFHAKVYSKEAPYPGSDTYRNYLHQLKQLRYGVKGKSTQKMGGSHKSTNADEPINPIGFLGNHFGGIPNDNDIAISNNGVIVSVSNSDMYVFDEQGNSIYDTGLDGFADSLGLVANSYDPKIMYDPNEDRFILIFLNGSTAASTNIVVCFSQSNDPTQSWNVYNLMGNPFNDNAWSDFPMVAMTEQDIFVTVNHINSDSASWQTGFMQSVIWQVQKAEGFQGTTISTKVHSNVDYNNQAIRNLLPIKGGLNLATNEMYFISNRNFDLVNDTFFLVHIPQSLNDNPNVDFQVSALLSNEEYGVPPDAKQTGSTFLQTNDARALSGFIENNRIHFVGNTVEDFTDLAAIYHGQIDLTQQNLSVDLEIISDDVLEYGYPNISFSGQNIYDEQAIISFNHTSIDSFPGVSAMFYHENNGYSNRVHLVSGSSNVSVINGNFQRWGDYTGSQNRYNQPGVVWVNGFMGFKNNFAVNTDQHLTFIASLISPDSLHTSISAPLTTSTKLFPNPSDDRFYLQFHLQESQVLQFDLYDVNGNLVKNLLKQIVKSGDNEFLFSTTSLSKGIYFLEVSNSFGKIVMEKKLFKK